MHFKKSVHIHRNYHSQDSHFSFLKCTVTALTSSQSDREADGCADLSVFDLLICFRISLQTGVRRMKALKERHSPRQTWSISLGTVSCLWPEISCIGTDITHWQWSISLGTVSYLWPEINCIGTDITHCQWSSSLGTVSCLWPEINCIGTDITHCQWSSSLGTVSCLWPEINCIGTDITHCQWSSSFGTVSCL